MKKIKTTLIGAMCVFALTAKAQETKTMEIKPMNKEVQKIPASENENEGAIKKEVSKDQQKVNAAPVRKAELKAVEPKQQVAEPK
jgi:hypothetical protein